MKIPTRKNIEAARYIRHELMTWKHSDTLLYNEFRRLDKNVNLLEVTHKVSILDYLYNCRLTRSISHTKAAEAIVGAKIDDDLRNGDSVKLVERIATLSGPKRENQRRLNIGTVFASKYCHFHAPDRFPIYDQYARRGLIDLLGTHFPERDYRQMKKGVDELTSATGLSYKEIDEYLWLYGQLLAHQSGERVVVVDKYPEQFSKLKPPSVS